MVCEPWRQWRANTGSVRCELFGTLKQEFELDERLARMNKATRLPVGIPALGWEVYVSTEQSGHTRAKIANISADGAFLITKGHFEPGSEVTLTVKSVLICFAVTGLVLRNDLYGITIRFLDLNEFTRNSILNLISRFLLRRWPEDPFSEEASLFHESQVNCDIEL